MLERAAVEIDPTLARPTQAARQQALAGTQDIEKKLVQHLKRRQETELGQLARVRTAVAPNGKPQERVLTVAPFLARYGPDLLAQLTDAFEAWTGPGLKRCRNRRRLEVCRSSRYSSWSPSSFPSSRSWSIPRSGAPWHAGSRARSDAARSRRVGQARRAARGGSG